MKDSNVLETAGTRVPLKQTPAAVLFIRCVGFSRGIEGGSRTAMVRARCALLFGGPSAQNVFVDDLADYTDGRSSRQRTYH